MTEGTREGGILTHKMGTEDKERWKWEMCSSYLQYMDKVLISRNRRPDSTHVM